MPYGTGLADAVRSTVEGGHRGGQRDALHAADPFGSGLVAAVRLAGVDAAPDAGRRPPAGLGLGCGGGQQPTEKPVAHLIECTEHRDPPLVRTGGGGAGKPTCAIWVFNAADNRTIATDDQLK
ncbi:hypothetical protein GCM10022419_126950 [Nonomuraea rosea]|uniref:Uncharacterized protein n=1 Tax=Nonomuraea rosea TaxID=638574 RepID=A0ABP6ZVS8_9ACTN